MRPRRRERFVQVAKVARRLRLPTEAVYDLFKDRPGVVQFPSGDAQPILLIPARLLKEITWSAPRLAEEFGLPVALVDHAFRSEPGVSLIQGALYIPESVRRRVFERYRNK